MRAAEDRLFVRFCRGEDPRLLAAVFDRTAPELLRVAVHLTGNRVSAEDLVQETFVAAIENRARFDAARGVLPWLLGILANLARRHRRAIRREVNAGRMAVGEEGTPLRAAQDQEFGERLTAALRELPEVYRQVLTLHLEHGLSAKEIGEALGRPAGTVRTQVVRGMDLLRKLLPHGFAAAGAGLLSTGHGLAAVREAVLASVPARCAAVGAATLAGASVLLGGALVMKQMLIGVAAVVVLATAVWGWRMYVEGFVAKERSEVESPAAMSAPTIDADQAPARGEQGELTRALVAAEAAPASTGSLRVRVLWADGGSAAGVGVFVTDALFYPPFDSRPALGQGRTDSDGSVEIEGLGPGQPFIVTDRGANQRAKVEVGARSEVVVQLPGGVTVRGQVVDYADRPVRNAAVLVSPGVVPDRGFEVGRSDDGGAFVLRDLPSDQLLGAQAPGWRPSGLVRVEGPPGTTRDVRLILGPPGQRLVGRVLDERGAVVPRALVGVAIPGPSPPKGYHWRQHELHLLDADDAGCFAIDWAPSGNLVLLAQRRGSGGMESVPRAYAEIACEPGMVPVDLVLRTTPAVFGVMRDEQGKPHVDREVNGFLRSPAFGGGGSRFQSVHARTAADGSYRLVGMLPGSWQLNAKFADGKAVERNLEIHPGEELRWDPVVPRGHAQRVRLTDPEGQPLVRWRVTWKQYGRGNWPPDVLDWQYVAQASTDGDGWARVDGLAPDDVRLLAQGPYDGTGSDPYARVVHDDVPATQPEVLVQLRPEHMPTARAIGRVLDARGKPMVDARVVVSPEKGGHVQEVPTDAEGRFTLGPMAPARLTFGIRATNHPWFGLDLVELLRDRTHDFGDVRLPAPARLAVRVKVPKGVDLASVRPALAWQDSPAQGHQFPSPPSGDVLHSAPLAAGDYILYVHGPRVHPVARPVTLREGEEATIDLDLRAGSPVSLAITFCEQAAMDGIADGVLRVADAQGATLVYETIFGYFDDLTQRLLRRELSLLPGDYVVEVSDHAAASTVRRAIVVPEGSEVESVAIVFR